MWVVPSWKVLHFLYPRHTSSTGGEIDRWMAVCQAAVAFKREREVRERKALSPTLPAVWADWQSSLLFFHGRVNGRRLSRRWKSENSNSTGVQRIRLCLPFSPVFFTISVFSISNVFAFSNPLLLFFRRLSFHSPQLFLTLGTFRFFFKRTHLRKMAKLYSPFRRFKIFTTRQFWHFYLASDMFARLLVSLLLHLSTLFSLAMCNTLKSIEGFLFSTFQQQHWTLLPWKFTKI